LRRITEGLGREPTTVEVYAFDAQWSEHCSYKSSRHLLKQLPTTGPDVVLGPGEDAGILHLGEHNGERYGVVVAHESHNHPSQVVPFEGAATGVGGIVRDVLCMGAEVIALADCLRFGNVDDPNSHQRYVAQQVVAGIAAYGNAIGVPNIAGDVYFDEGFNDNCLVNVIALGLVKENEIIHSRAPEGSAGWDIVLVGKATDASGFGGASFSSLTLEEGNQEANKSAVQVPDPFLKNVIMRATYRVFEYLREKKITAGFKDLGAGGIMGCTAELCAAGGYGAIIDLDDVNVALENLPPEVIAVGETQERLCWVLPGDATADILRIYNEEFSLPEIARGARAVVIGAVQAEKKYVMRHGSDIVMDVPIEFLTGTISEDGSGGARAIMQQQNDSSGAVSTLEFTQELLPQVLSHRDVCDRAPLYRQYDTAVRGRTAVPRGASDAGLVVPIAGSRLGVALAVSGNPRYGKIDPYHAAQYSVLTAVHAVAATGAAPIGLTDCLNFGNPNDGKQYGELSRSVEGLAAAARELGLPFASGNVSLYNESTLGAVPASPIVACIGRTTDIAKTVRGSLAASYSCLYFVGEAQHLLGGSVAAELLREKADALPKIDFAGERRRLGFVLEAIEKGYILSARAVADGGILATVAKMGLSALPDPLGVCFAFPDFFAPPELGDVETFLGESPGWVVQISSAALGWDRDGDPAPFWDLCIKHKLTNRKDYFAFANAGFHEEIDFDTFDTAAGPVTWSLDDLSKAWSAPLAEVYA
jgi:phosphoribosylformylglycinamidine synthase II